MNRLRIRRWLALLVVALAPSSAAGGAIARSTADQPDDSSLPQIHLMYVVPSDGVDRGFDVNGTIVDSTASWEGWLAGQTGGRSLRLDTYLGRPDVTFARLPQSDAQIAANGPYVRDEVQTELHALGFDAPNKVYAVFYDGSSTFPCGGGAWPPTLPGNVAALYLRGVQSGTRALTCTRDRANRRGTAISRWSTRSCTRSASSQRAHPITRSPGTCPTIRAT